MVIVTAAGNLFQCLSKFSWRDIVDSRTHHSELTSPSLFKLKHYKWLWPKQLTFIAKSVLTLTKKLHFCKWSQFFHTTDALEGQPHFWHELYSLSYTKVHGLFYVGQPLHSLVLDLLHNCRAMSNRSTIVRGLTLEALPLKNWLFCLVVQSETKGK